MDLFGIACFSIIPLRSDPSEKSEMASQLLFGESYKVIEKRKKWVYIETIFDGYEGWIDIKMHQPLHEQHFNKLSQKKPHVNQEFVRIFDNPEYLFPINLVPGSSIYLNHKSEHFDLAGNQYYLMKNTLKPDDASRNISETAYQYLNAPYLWGGRSPFGIDCSGYTQIVYKINGLTLPRDASQQVEMGNTIDFIGDMKTGDLAFFDDDEGNIVHVGIVIENNRIIHASGKVRIDQLDHQGIFNKEMNDYSHKLRIIKRIN